MHVIKFLYQQYQTFHTHSLTSACCSAVTTSIPPYHHTTPHHTLSYPGAQAKEMLFQEEEERKADVARTTAGLRRAELDVQVQTS